MIALMEDQHDQEREASKPSIWLGVFELLLAAAVVWAGIEIAIRL